MKLPKEIWMCENEQARWFEFEQPHDLPNDVTITKMVPKRTFVGLTDEEILQGNKESWVTLQAWQSSVWWAEAKLKERNT